LILVASCCFAAAEAAQDESPAGRTHWENATRPFWQVDVGYPVRASAGLTVVAGQRRRLNGYESKLRGVSLGADVGLTGLSARVGWADLRPYDAGMSGYSADVVFVRPMGVDSRFDRGGSYVGGGMSYYFFYFRFSAAW
jgi:hypothetical protein